MRCWSDSFFLVLSLSGNEHKPLGELLLCVIACMHVLQLMDKECYKDIEKIKTIGSTYMAAVGLVPTIGTKVEGFFYFCCFCVFRCTTE